MRAKVAEQDNGHPDSSDQTDTGQTDTVVQADLSGLSQASLQLLTRLQGALAELHPRIDAFRDMPQITIEAADLAKACRVLKNDPRINAAQLMCLACVDYQESFQLVYMLHSLDPEASMVLKADLPYEAPVAPSVTSVWRAADWYEREAHDLFGVVFEGHPDLAPLLLYEGFEGFPGRKEFPFHEYQGF